jgi:hypothetical protein
MKVEDRLPAERLDELLAALEKSGATVRSGAGAKAKLAELRGLYEPYAAALADYLRLSLPPIWPAAAGPDNWQTSAGMRRAASLARLAEIRDDHFE